MRTRKHYIVMAAALKALRVASTAAGQPVPSLVSFNRVVKAVADVLAADNPRFDRERFIDACGGTR